MIKKLQLRIFLIIFISLSFLLFGIMFIYNYENLKNQNEHIERSLSTFTGLLFNNKIFKPIEFGEETETGKNHYNETESSEDYTESDFVFSDSSIYVISLNIDNEILEVYNYGDKEISDEDIEKIALNIISGEYSGTSSTQTIDLYKSSYVYGYKTTPASNTLVIMDITSYKTAAYRQLYLSILIFITGLGVIFAVASVITKSIVKPVKETITKQKQFITDASHELKTPLTVIIANAEMLENNKSKKWLDNIKNESMRMSNLVNNLLDLAKVEQDEKATIKSNQNLSLIIEKALLPFEAKIYDANIKLDYNIDKDVYFKCDEESIKQLVGILIDNAIKNTSSKGKINISLSKTDKITLDVENTGKPIPKEEREKIFERFYKLDKSRNRNDNSYGLGLSIASSIVLNHGGKIWVECSENTVKFKVSF